MRSLSHPVQGGSTPWSRTGGAVARPRHRLRACSIALATLALSARTSCAQVFEVTEGSIRQVDAFKPAIASIAPHEMTAAVKAAAARYGLAPELLDTVARRESGYRAGAVSRAGAVGVMQLMPATARALGVDPWDPVSNLNGGAAYLRAQLDRFGGRIDLALAAYNAGPAAVERHAGVPPYRETRAYIAANLKRLAEQSLAAPSTLNIAGQP
jgi:soluble lytic murein transglycosylase-like protein